VYQPPGTLSLWLAICSVAMNAYPDAGHRHDAVFHHIAGYDTVHAANDRVKHGKQGKDDTVNMGYVLWCYIKWHM
jgi:hypothetical protein